MDEMFAELFVHHLQAWNFEGNPWSAFSAKVRGFEYSPDETPRTIGLYAGRYTAIVKPGECIR